MIKSTSTFKNFGTRHSAAMTASKKEGNLVVIISEEDRKIAMKEIRESDWFGLAEQTGFQPKIKVSPHSLFNQENRGLGL
jgi:hypothetical protein